MAALFRLESVIIAIAFFIIGFIAGIYFQRIFFDKLEIEDWQRSYVVLVITTIFAGSIIVDWLNPSYTTSPFLYSMMGMIVAFFYKPKKGGKRNT